MYTFLTTYSLQQTENTAVFCYPKTKHYSPIFKINCYIFISMQPGNQEGQCRNLLQLALRVYLPYLVT